MSSDLVVRNVRRHLSGYLSKDPLPTYRLPSNLGYYAGQGAHASSKSFLNLVHFH